MPAEPLVCLSVYLYVSVGDLVVICVHVVDTDGTVCLPVCLTAGRSVDLGLGLYLSCLSVTPSLYVLMSLAPTSLLGILVLGSWSALYER